MEPPANPKLETRNYWEASGFRLLDHDPGGGLVVTDDFLRAYFLRPEVGPVEESCDAERALHAALMEEPRRAVADADIDGMQDPDARDNYRAVLRFRDLLLGADTVEQAYVTVFRKGAAGIAPLFIDQMVHVIVRSILGDTPDPMQARSAELLFREQKVTISDGVVMAADQETVEMHAGTGGFGDLGRLLVEANTPAATVELDVLSAASADLYWERSDRYDTVLDLGFAGAGLDALCRVLEAWVAHFRDASVSIQPVQKITDERWVWHVGLDAEASSLLNDLYDDKEVAEDRLARLISLFRLDFADPSLMRHDIAGRPVYLGMAMTGDGVLRLKPQNLLVNLPVAAST